MKHQQSGWVLGFLVFLQFDLPLREVAPDYEELKSLSSVVPADSPLILWHPVFHSQLLKLFFACLLNLVCCCSSNPHTPFLNLLFQTKTNSDLKDSTDQTSELGK